MRTAKFAVGETMRVRGRSEVKLAKEFCVSENSVRRPLGRYHGSQMGLIDEALER